jgi:hypothetical protein
VPPADRGSEEEPKSGKNPLGSLKNVVPGPKVRATNAAVGPPLAATPEGTHP